MLWEVALTENSRAQWIPKITEAGVSISGCVTYFVLTDHSYDVSNAPLSYKRTSLLTVYCPATRQHEN